jgi:hypothetical protein
MASLVVDSVLAVVAAAAATTMMAGAECSKAAASGDVGASCVSAGCDATECISDGVAGSAFVVFFALFGSGGGDDAPAAAADGDDVGDADDDDDDDDVPRNLFESLRNMTDERCATSDTCRPSPSNDTSGSSAEAESRLDVVAPPLDGVVDVVVVAPPPPAAVALDAAAVVVSTRLTQ